MEKRFTRVLSVTSEGKEQARNAIHSSRRASILLGPRTHFHFLFSLFYSILLFIPRRHPFSVHSEVYPLPPWLALRFIPLLYSPSPFPLHHLCPCKPTSDVRYISPMHNKSLVGWVYRRFSQWKRLSLLDG